MSRSPIIYRPLRLPPDGHKKLKARQHHSAVFSPLKPQCRAELQSVNQTKIPKVATGFRTFMLQSRVAPLSRVAECTLSRLPRRPRPGQSGQHGKIPVSETQCKPELCLCHVTLVQAEQVCPSELKSHHDVRIPM